MRAAIYVRISQDQTGQGLGVARQLEDCTEHAQALGWEIAEVYRDNDISAASGKPRPDYRRMLTDIDAGRIDGIIAWHADRLYRRAVDLGELVDVCKRNNTQIATVKAGTIDLTTPTGRLVAGLLAQVATYEGEAKSDRWKRSWRQGRESGAVARTGSRLYGYTREGQVIESEKAVVLKMADDLLGGKSFMSVGQWLRDNDIRGTRGGTWTLAAIKQYLTNPRIAGWSTLKGEIVAEGDWEPLIDRETWEGLRALLTARTRTHVPRKSLLNGLIFCGECGHRLITSNARGKRTYRCPNRPGMEGCGRLSGNAEPVEQIVEAFARRLIDEPETRRRIAELRAEPSGAQAEIVELDLRITELEAQLDEPGTPVSTILRAIDRAKERQDMLLAKVAAVPTAPLPVRGGEWPHDLRLRRALVDLVVERVELHKTERRSNTFDENRVKVFRREGS